MCTQTFTMVMQEQGTVRAVSAFDAEKDAEIIRKAMKGMGKHCNCYLGVIADCHMNISDLIQTRRCVRIVLARTPSATVSMEECFYLFSYCLCCFFFYIQHYLSIYVAKFIASAIFTQGLVGNHVGA